jgi:hypothetical protein
MSEPWVAIEIHCDSIQQAVMVRGKEKALDAAMDIVDKWTDFVDSKAAIRTLLNADGYYYPSDLHHDSVHIHHLIIDENE